MGAWEFLKNHSFAIGSAAQLPRTYGAPAVRHRHRTAAILAAAAPHTIEASKTPNVQASAEALRAGIPRSISDFVLPFPFPLICSFTTSGFSKTNPSFHHEQFSEGKACRWISNGEQYSAILRQCGAVAGATVSRCPANLRSARYPRFATTRQRWRSPLRKRIPLSTRDRDSRSRESLSRADSFIFS